MHSCTLIAFSWVYLGTVLHGTYFVSEKRFGLYLALLRSFLYQHANLVSSQSSFSKYLDIITITDRCVLFPVAPVVQALDITYFGV